MRISLATCIFGLYGQYVLPRGGQVWLGTLVQAMSTLGFGEAAVRSHVLRMRKRGYLQSRRQGRRSYYWLTDRGMSKLNWRGFRFSIPPDERWDGQWTVVVYSIPEEQREHRDVLRNTLDWWGFGMLAPGTWISTRSLPPKVESLWQELDIEEYVDVFRSRYLGPANSTTIATKVFPQLITLSELYRDYVAESESILHQFKAGLFDDKACFAHKLRNMAKFVPIIFEDPVLPPSLLPENWPRPKAERLSQEVQRTLAESAEHFFDSIVITQPTPPQA